MDALLLEDDECDGECVFRRGTCLGCFPPAVGRLGCLPPTVGRCGVLYPTMGLPPAYPCPGGVGGRPASFLRERVVPTPIVLFPDAEVVAVPTPIVLFTGGGGAVAVPTPTLGPGARRSCPGDEGGGGVDKGPALLTGVDCVQDGEPYTRRPSSSQSFSQDSSGTSLDTPKSSSNQSSYALLAMLPCYCFLRQLFLRMN